MNSGYDRKETSDEKEHNRKAEGHADISVVGKKSRKVAEVSDRAMKRGRTADAKLIYFLPPI